MIESTVLARIRQYVQETFLYTQPDLVLAEHDRLLEKGVIDSMGMLELVDFLQSEFGVAVRDDDITEQNLGTLTSIARYVASRNGNGGGHR